MTASQFFESCLKRLAWVPPKPARPKCNSKPFAFSKPRLLESLCAESDSARATLVPGGGSRAGSEPCKDSTGAPAGLRPCRADRDSRWAAGAAPDAADVRLPHGAGGLMETASASAGSESADPLKWDFLQCFGERSPGEDIQEGAQPLLCRTVTRWATPRQQSPRGAAESGDCKSCTCSRADCACHAQFSQGRGPAAQHWWSL